MSTISIKKIIKKILEKDLDIFEHHFRLKKIIKIFQKKIQINLNTISSKKKIIKKMLKKDSDILEHHFH